MSKALMACSHEAVQGRLLNKLPMCILQKGICYNFAGPCHAELPKNTLTGNAGCKWVAPKTQQLEMSLLRQGH